MKELKFHHIASHLPFKLMSRCDKATYKQSPNDRIGIIDHWYADTNEISITSERGYYLCKISECTPILHPLSDLTKPIKVEGYNDGKEFIPIVELAGIEQGNYDEGSFIVRELDICQVITRKAAFEEDAHICEWKTGLGDQKEILNYNNGNGFNAYYYFRSDYSDLSSRVLHNQKELFKKLYQWHFDIDNLIEQKLAVDINSIK